MKNFKFISVVLCALLAVSCSKDKKTKVNLSSSDPENQLSKSLQDSILNSDAELTGVGLVSFFNRRLDPELSKKKRSVLSSVRDELLKSEDLYLCVNDSLNGYLKGPFKGKKQKLKQNLNPVLELDVSPVEISKNNKIYKFIMINYGGIDYWAAQSVTDKKTKATTSYISKFSDCSFIQSELEALKSEEVLQILGNEYKPNAERSFFRYVCTKDKSPLNASYTKKRKNEDKLIGGSEVSLVQSSDSKPFKAKNGHTYIRVQHNGKRYWVAQDFIKRYEDCPQIHSENTLVCSEQKTSFYKDDEALERQIASGQFVPLQSVHKFYGEVYDKKTVVLKNGKEVTYVPVKAQLDSNEIYWVEERLVPSKCEFITEIKSKPSSAKKKSTTKKKLGPDSKITYKGKYGSCKVRKNDNFPLGFRAKFNYYTDSAKFGAGRSRGRKHAAADLYSYKRYTKQANYTWGTAVRAVDDGKVVSIANYGRGCKRVTIQSKYGYTWNYAEVGKVKVRVDQWVKRNKLIGTTRKYGRGNKFPAMLHLEKYNRRITNPKEGKINRRYKRSNALVNPSCHIEYMEKNKFGKRR